MGFFQSIYALGMFGGPLLQGWPQRRWGFAGAFYATAAVTALVVLALAAALAPQRQEKMTTVP